MKIRGRGVYNKLYMVKSRAVLFIISELLLIILIILLVIKIYELGQNKIKSIQFISILPKDDLIFDQKTGLKYFYEPKPNTKQKRNPNWLGYEITNTINTDSLNERYDYPVDKPIKSFRIITIGDSFTYGAYVNTADNYSEILEQILNQELKCSDLGKFEIINLGVGGYDIEYTVERFLKRGLKYNPDLVIWFIGGWNFKKINEISIPLEEKKVKDGIAYFNTKSGVYEANVQALKDMQNDLGIDKILDYQSKVMNRMADNYDNKLLIITFKNINSTYHNLISDYIKTKSKYFYYNGLTVNKNLTLLDDHPNIEGHKKIADDIFQYLKKNMLIKCN